MATPLNLRQQFQRGNLRTNIVQNKARQSSVNRTLTAPCGDQDVRISSHQGLGLQQRGNATPILTEVPLSVLR